MKQGKLIVVEGLDGSGKATQAEQLSTLLQAGGRTVRRISFPNYGSDAANLLDDYLHGGFGTDPDAVNPYAASTFFAIDRFASFHRDWKNDYYNNSIIIADRYTTANAVHQCAKLPQTEWDGFLEWLFNYEYRLLGLPEPDAVIYLRVTPELSQKLLTGRYQGDETKKDIHESDTEYLAKCRVSADYCAEKLGWHTVQCDCGGAMRQIPEIAAELLNIAEAVL
ncbi:MAG: deoxynucleoside kinase [Oscillospiraceae bacterium]|nr:deoxynucleoside kinase [Oscillospiraceae bacterium]